MASLPFCIFFLGKIEVKILTRKNAEEAGDQWLTEEDTKSFRELLINLLVTEVIVTFIWFIWILLGVSYAQFNCALPADVCCRVCLVNDFSLCENRELFCVSDCLRNKLLLSK